ncbi:MAG: HAD family hydrolase, partial [Myxococcales bacterium]
MRLRRLPFSSAEALAEHVRSESLFERFRVVSFDLFDTILLRLFPPETAADVVGRWLVAKLTAAGRPPRLSPFRARQLAFERHAEEARRAGFDAEAGLETFAPTWVAELAGGEFPDSAILAQGTIDVAIDAEIRATRPNMFLVELAREAKAAGCRVAMASDTVYSAPFVARLLAAHGLSGLFDEIYTSSDRKRFKWSGRLYEALVEAEKARPEEVLHIGDNPYADGRAARRRGV